MWWAGVLDKEQRAIQDRWCTPRVLNQQGFGMFLKTWANADGDPAADG